MSAKRHRIARAAALTLALSGGVIARGAAQPVNEIALRKAHHAKAAHLVWIPGFWDITGSISSSPRAGWVWAPGRWVMQPVPGARWVAGDWGWRQGWYSWVPGHWELPRK
jgi:hypothetical protein